MFPPKLHPILTMSLWAFALAGCVAYHPKVLDASRTQAQLERRSLDDAGLRQFLADRGQPVSETWDLPRLTLAAFYFSPELDVARARWAVAEAEVGSAESRPNPTASVAPGYDVNAADGVTPWINLYGLSIPIETAGKRRYRTAAAEHYSEGARLRLASAAWSARSAVRRALIELHAAEDAAALWRKEQPLLAEAAKVLDVEAQSGEISAFEAAQPHIALSRGDLALRESERAVASARSALAEAIGIPLPALAAARLSYPSLNKTDLPSLAESRGWAARSRADLLEALADYEASQSALHLEIARQYPDFTLGPADVFDQGEGKWSLLLSAVLPVLDRNQGPIAAALARRDEAAARFLAQQNHVLAEVDRASENYESALGSLVTTESIHSTLERQAQALRAEEKSGEISRLELARFELELADNARAELDARVHAEEAFAALEDAVQRPLAWPESAWRKSGRSAAD